MDITIIGAGPGGLVTGLMLIEAGYKPTIIERKPEIESTLCAEGLSKDTLARVPFGPWDKYSPEPLETATLIFPSGQKCYVSKTCYTMDRTSWFRAMAKTFQDKGGTLEMGKEITEENFKDLSFDILIDSSGPTSWIARKLVGNTMETKPGVQYRMRIPDYPYDGMEFFLDKRYSDEYSWIFAKGDTANVGLLGSWAQLDQFVKDKGLENGEILKREAWPIPFFGTRYQKGNILLMGDGAGITNPLTKGGMAGCIFAAEILVQCIKEGKIEEYEKRLRAHPVVAPEYGEALHYYRKMTNEQLDRIGNAVDGKDLSNLPSGFKFKLMLGSLLKWKKMRTLMKAASHASKYSW